MKSISGIVLTILMLCSPDELRGQQTGHSDAERIRSARSDYNAAIARQDAKAITGFLDDEYQITTSLGQLLQDRDAEESSWVALFRSRKDLLYVRTPESIEVSRDYPLAAEQGNWVGTWQTDEGPVKTGGQYTAMWREVEGVWKVRSELFVALYCDGVQCP